ncbi:MAG TPA: hypothetical protein VKA08_02400 [Balneolales bacterium]|nr:hypothetical protein [Balneolales bacterium]
MNIKKIKDRWSEFFKTDRGKALGRWVRRLFLAAMVIWLLYQLTEIGWENVWKSLPVDPLFYVLLLILYLALPVSQIFVYGLIWKFPKLKSFLVFLLMKVYNQNVVGYSGEVYLYFWARKNVPKKDIELLKDIKDNNILSSISSTIIAVGLLSAFFLTDQIALFKWLPTPNSWYITAGIIVLIILGFLIYKFRHFIISMPYKTAGSIFGIHSVRLLFIQFIQILQWHIELPKIPLHIWFTFVAIQLIMSRIPFLPNQDLLFFGTSIKLTGVMHIPKAEIAGLLLANQVVGKLISFALFSLTSLLKGNELVPDIPHKEDEKDKPDLKLQEAD